MNHIEQMKSWLEVLEHLDYEDNDRDFLFPYQRTMLDNAITTLRTAIEQMEKQEPVAITEQMAFAFHNAITDGAIGTDDLMDIMRGLEAAFAHIATPPAAQREWVEVEQVKWEGDKLIAKLREKNGGTSA